MNRNQVLEISEFGDKVSFKVEQIDKPIYEKNFFDSEEKAYTGIKITAKNLNNNEVSIANYDFFILDSNDNEIDMQMPGLSAVFSKSIDQSTILDNKLEANEEVTKYIYFETDSKDIAKLKISVYTKDVTENKTVFQGKDGKTANLYRKYYYINLK